MLKSAIYLNVFIIFGMSIFFLVKAFNKDASKTLSKKTLKWSILTYAIYNFFSFCFLYDDIVYTGWDFLLLFPASMASAALHIISICRINSKKSELPTSNNFSNSKVCHFIIPAPFLVFIIPYLYELCIINNCNYLLKYDYSQAMSHDYSYLAIIGNKPASITLQKNLFMRQGISTDAIRYGVAYNDSSVVISAGDSYSEKVKSETTEIEKVALGAKRKYQAATSAKIYHFPEKNYYIITLWPNRTRETFMAHISEPVEYFCHDDTYIEISTLGSIESVKYYE